MEHRSDLVRMSEQLLRVAEVKHTLHPIVPPVTLPKKYISLLKSPNINREHNISPQSTSTIAYQASSSSPSTPKVKHETRFSRQSFRNSITRRRKSTKTSEILPGSVYSDDGSGQLSDGSPPSSLSRLSRQLASAVSRSISRSSKHRSSSESRDQETRNKDVSKETKQSLRRKSTQRIPSESKTQLSPNSQKRDVMQFIQEQEQSLQERFLSMPPQVHKKQRPLTPTLQQSAGLEHLDNLVRLMEQLTALKDENNKLRKRCDYLESTRTLLETKRDIIPDRSTSLGFLTPQSNHRYDHKRGILVDSKVESYDNKLNNPRKSKSEEFQILDITDSSSDEGSIKCTTSTLSRSFSTGSLAAPTERGKEVVEMKSKKRNKGHNRRIKSKQKSKSSKWSRVKQALTGQKPHDDEQATERTFRDQRRASNYPPRGNTLSADDSRSTWYTASESDREVQPTKRSIAAKKQYQEDEDPDLTTEIWMGPPAWWEEYESRREGSGTSSNSQASSIIEITTMYLGSPKDTTTSTIKSRVTTTPTASPEDRITSAHLLGETTEEDTPSKDSSIRQQKKAALHKSSSGKSADLDIAENMEFQQTEKKPHRSAWGRVKDIIHTRKDSIKKKLKKDRLGIENEDNRDNTTDVQSKKAEALFENSTGQALGSPLAVNKQKTNVGSQSPPKKTSMSPKSSQGFVHGNVDMAALLAGGVSEEFSKKMQEWEQLKSKKSAVTARASADESDLGSLEFPQEFPVHTIDLRDFKGKVPDSGSEVVTTEECNTSMEVLGAPSESIDEKGRRKGGSFSSRLQVEREEAKLERERKKVEKQRIRTLECEEKLEKLKDRLIQSEAIGQRSVGASFRGGSHTHSTQEGAWNSNRANNNAEETQKDTERPKRNSTEDTTPLDETNSETSAEEAEDEATAAQKSLTKSHIASLERANTQLLENLHKKEIEYAAVQEEVRKVNEKLAKVREDHEAEMVRFHSDLAKGKFAGPVKLEVGELEATADELEEKIKMMENFGEKLASSMESAAIGKWQSIEAEDTVHKQLLELIEEMRNMLIEASQSKEYNEKILALSNFETRYAQAMKLQVQMNNLRLSHLERNREIMVIKRQLLLQEVNNLLLQADITRKETELYQFQEAKIFGTAKRWYTSGTSERQRQQMQTSSSAVTSTYLKAGTHKEARPRQLETPLINIPYQSEEVTLAPPASSSSALPSTAEKADGSWTHLPAAVGEQLNFAKEGMGDEFTDHVETFNDQSACRGESGVSGVETGLTQRPIVASMAGSGEQTTLSSPQFSEFANQVLSKKCPSELPFVSSSEIQKDSTFFLENSSKSVSETDSADDTVDEKSFMHSTQLNTFSKVNIPKKALAQPLFTTVCDSVPLHNEIAELRRVKCEVEKDVYPLKQKMAGVSNPIHLGGKQLDNNSSLSASAPVALDQVSLQKPELENSQSLRSQQPLSAPEFHESAQCRQQTNLDSKQEEIELADSRSQQSGKNEYNLELISYTSNVNSGFSPASFNRSKVMLEQRENKDVQQMKTCTASQRDNHDLMKGKPPLPRHVSPVRYSTPVVPVKERGPRSKSVGDMDRSGSGFITSKPLQEVVSKFEARANVCNTKDPQFSVRKVPSPTLHLPRVGLVSRVCRIKPSAELLAESRRYILGHAAHATSVLKTPSRSTVNYTAEGGKQTLGSTNDYTPEGSNQKRSYTVDYTPQEDNAKSRPTDDTLKGDSQKPCSEEDHMQDCDSQKYGSINYDMQKVDMQKSDSTKDHTTVGVNQKPNSRDHTQEGDKHNVRSMVDYSLEGDSQASASIKAHTPERDNKKLSCTKDHTQKMDNQTTSSRNDHTRERSDQKFSSNEEHMQRGDNQKPNPRSSHRIKEDKTFDKESVPYTYINRLSQDTSLADDSRSRLNSDLLPKRTEEVSSQTKCAQRSSTHLLSQNLPDTSSSNLNEQVYEKQKTQLSNVFNDDGESKRIVRNINSETDQQPNNASAPEDLIHITKKNDGVAPAFNTELNISSSRSLIKDHGVHTQMSTSPHLLPATSAEATDHELHCEDHRNDAGASSGASRIKTKRNKDLLIQSASAPASPCPQHAQVITKSKWKSERLSKEKISQPFPSPGKNRKSRRQNETVEALCKQSISAAINPALDETRFLTSQVCVTSVGSPQSPLQSDMQSKQESTQLFSRRTEAEASPSSPVTKEKIKSARLLDTKWLQKSKKFFKVSK